MSKETTYQFIKRIENTMDFTILLKKGLIPMSLLSNKVYYEHYQQQRQRFKKMQSISNTSVEYNVSDMTIRRAIKFMEE